MPTTTASKDNIGGTQFRRPQQPPVSRRERLFSIGFGLPRVTLGSSSIHQGGKVAYLSSPQGELCNFESYGDFNPVDGISKNSSLGMNVAATTRSGQSGTPPPSSILATRSTPAQATLYSAQSRSRSRGHSHFSSTSHPPTSLRDPRDPFQHTCSCWADYLGSGKPGCFLVAESISRRTAASPSLGPQHGVKGVRNMSAS